MKKGGVFLNIGSAVTGPEVFLKACSMAANVGNAPTGVVTAVFDFQPADPADVDELDRMIRLVEEIETYFWGGRLSQYPAAMITAAANEPIYSPDHLHRLGIFTGVLTLTYEVVG